MKKINSFNVTPKHTPEFFSRFEIYSTLDNGTSPLLVAVGCSFSPFYITVYSPILNSLTTYGSLEDVHTVYVKYNRFEIKFLDKSIKMPNVDNKGEEAIN